MPDPLLERPFFVVGSERSGSTMLGLMLLHHPRIAFAGQFEFIVDPVPEAEGAAWPDADAVRDRLEQDRVFRNLRLDFDPSLAYPDQARGFLAQIRDRAEGQPAQVGATVHFGFHRLPTIWPEARYIHLLRDPRDVSRSVIGMGWAGNVWTGVRLWLEAEREWDVLRSRIRPDQFTEVMFEQVVLRPAEELSRLCEFLGLEYDPAMLSYPEHSTYDAPDPKLVNQWKRKLSEREVQLVESRVGDLLAGRGYEPSGLPRIEVDAAEEARLRRQDYWYRVKRRLKFLGPWLFTANYLSKRIGPEPIRRMVQRRVDDRINASRK